MKNVVLVISQVGFQKAVSRRFEPLILEYSKRGCRVQILCSESNTPSSHNVHFTETLFKLPSNKQGFVKRSIMECLWGLEVGVRLLFSRQDICHVTTPPYVSFLVYSLFLTKAKLVIDVRDNYPDILDQLGVLPKSSIVFRLLSSWTKHIYSNAKLVATVTPGLVRHISQKYNCSTTALSTNGYPDLLRSIDHSRFKSPNTFKIVMHGTLGAAQNIELLARLIHHYRNDDRVKFIVIGDGPKADLLTAPDFKNLNYHRSLPDNAMFPLIASCDLGLSLRIDGHISMQSLPVKVFEYLAFDIPVISTPQSEVDELIIKGDLSGYSLPNNLEIIVNNIERLWKAKELGITCLATDAKANYSRSNLAEAYINLIYQKDK